MFIQFETKLFCSFITDDTRIEVWYDPMEDRSFKVKDENDYDWSYYSSLKEVLKKQTSITCFELTDFGKGYLCGLQKSSGITDLL